MRRLNHIALLAALVAVTCCLVKPARTDSVGLVTVQQSTAANLKVDLSGTAANATAIKVDNSAVTQPSNIAQVSGTTLDTNSGNKSAGTIRVAIATDQPQLTNKLLVTPDANSTVVSNAATSGGCSISSFITTGAANQDQTSVDASPGQVYSVAVFNTTTAARYLKLYNTASPTSSSTPVVRIGLPAFTTGSGAVIPIPVGAVFATAIGARVTTGIADNDTGACSTNDCLVNIFYK